MLKKIVTNELRTGMYIHALCGSWMANPFWRKSFLISSDDLCMRVRSSGVREIWIDTDKGRDVVIDNRSDTPSENSFVLEGMHANSFQFSNITPSSTTHEFDRAAQLIAKSKEAVTAMFSEARMGRFSSIEHADSLVDEIALSVIRNTQALISLSRLKQSDDYTYMHSVAVCAMMVALARQLGMAEEEVRLCGKAGLLHDLGKMAIDHDVLNKPGPLTDQEFMCIQTHPQSGYEMLLSINDIPPAVLDVCLHHHEKFNGHGYPSGLCGEEISIYARMGAVCDVYDAITSNRPYKLGWCPSESLRRMAEWAKDGHFDQAIFEAFVKCVGIYPIGTLLKLKSGRLAVVIDISKSLLRPMVNVFFSTKSMTYLQPYMLDLSLLADTEGIASCEDASAWKLTDINKYWGQDSKH